jgi:glycine cleavage system H protein
MDAAPPASLPYKRARFATELPLDRLYTPSHFWIAPQPDHTCRIGLTKLAARMMGEMVDCGFELQPDAAVASGQVIGWIEGFKAVSDVFCIADGRFAGTNPALENHLALINQDPLGAGWLYSVRGKPDATCVDAHAYVKLLDDAIDKMLSRDT